MIALRTPASYAKYEFLIELKHIKKSKATEARFQAEFDDAVRQIAKYMNDKRLASRPELKKFVVVFVGVEIARLEELE